MNIQKRIDSLNPYVIGIRFVEGISVVDVVLKEGWNILKSELIDSQKGENDEGINYYMFYTNKEGLGLDEILDFVEAVINHNIEREKKYELLKAKVKELQTLFKKHSLSELQRMKFVIPTDSLIPDVMPEDPLDSIDIDEEPMVEEIPEEPKKNQKRVPKAEAPNVDKEVEEFNRKNGKVELPPKKQKIEVETFDEPNIVCKCGPNEVCPVCEEEKMSSY